MNGHNLGPLAPFVIAGHRPALSSAAEIGSIKTLSDEAAASLAEDLRLIARAMSCTQEELSEEFASAEPEEVEFLLHLCKDIADRLREFANMVDEAVARWIVAAPPRHRDRRQS